MPCPCGLDQSYEQCCGRFIEQQALPQTPEQLMRSRYTAFTQARIDYIAATQTLQAAKKFDRNSAREWAENCQWLGLQVLSSQASADKGEVEFIARFKEADREQFIHELSQFKKIKDRWFYVGGRTPNVSQTRVGRNELCPCGSGKKFKRCCSAVL